jgi:hypothetical protein
MMVMMVNVLLHDGTSGLRFASPTGILFGQSTPDTEPRNRRQRPATSCASIGRIGREIACPFFRQAMDRFRRRCDCIRAGLRPAEIGRQAVKELLNLLVVNRLVVGRSGRLGIVSHCNLTRSIVGEFAA